MLSWSYIALPFIIFYIHITTSTSLLFTNLDTLSCMVHLIIKKTKEPSNDNSPRPLRKNNPAVNQSQNDHVNMKKSLTGYFQIEVYAVTLVNIYTCSPILRNSLPLTARPSPSSWPPISTMHRDSGAAGKACILRGERQS